MSSVPTPPPYELPEGQRPRPARRGGLWVLAVGAVIALVALVLCGLGGWSVAQTMEGIAQEPVRDGTSTVQLDAGEDRAVWAETTSTECTVEDPDGPVGSRPASEQTVGWAGTDLYVIHEVPADVAGSYTVTCDGPYRVGDTMPIGATLGVVGAIGAGCFGVVLAAIGLVVWLIRRR